MEFEPVLGVEIHAELQTKSKMFCGCPVVDTTTTAPNSAVCPVCSGMPGTLPVPNQMAVEYALRVALALNCKINPTSIFARKNYFYPDLPKGYQITQYEQPLAYDGHITFLTSQGERTIRIRRAHLEEDTGKLTHITNGKRSRTLIDLNRAGVPLLEIVTEPEFRSAEEVRVYAQSLRLILRYLDVNSGDLQKGVLRIEPNISLRPAGSTGFGTRVEIKNLNSFRALERAIAQEVQRQTVSLNRGQVIQQVTLGWDDEKERNLVQRVKEGEEDYRYFPEPDLPPLILDEGWIAQTRASLPELPFVRFRRFCDQYELPNSTASTLTEEQAIADYFERAVQAAPSVPAKIIANWVTGELFGLMNQTGVGITDIQIQPEALAELVEMMTAGQINRPSAKIVLDEMFLSGKTAHEIVTARGLKQVSDTDLIARVVSQVLVENPNEVASYQEGKTAIVNWLCGQVMEKVGGQANPQVVRRELERKLASLEEREA